jgi:hypothetical protein
MADIIRTSASAAAATIFTVNFSSAPPMEKREFGRTGNDEDIPKPRGVDKNEND